jgi:hypothetical protein
MAITKERISEICASVSEKTGDNEEIMNLLKEITDNYEMPDNGLIYAPSGKTWKEEAETTKREYRERFFSGRVNEDPNDMPPDDDDPAKEVKFEDIFKEVK